MARPEQNECKCGGFVFVSPDEVQHTLPVCEEFKQQATAEDVAFTREGTALRITDVKRVVKTAVYVRTNDGDEDEDDEDGPDVDDQPTTESEAAHDGQVERKQGADSTLRD